MLDGHVIATSGGHTEEAARAEQRSVVFQGIVITMIGGDTLHLLARPENEADALVQPVRHDIEDALAPAARGAARLLDDEGDRIGLIEEAQPAGLLGVLGVARIEEDAATHQNAMRLRKQRRDPA